MFLLQLAAEMTQHSFDESTLKIRKLFPTPLVSCPVPDAQALNERLSAAIFAEETRSRGVQHSNQGGWQSEGDFASWSGEAGAYLLGFAQDMARSLTAVHTADNTLVHATFEWHFNAWANINRAGDSNGVHGHAGAFWSAVYWVDDGGRADDPSVGGDLEFLDPRGLVASAYRPELRMRIEECVAAGCATTEAARSGTLVMFPSWLLHSVRPFKGTRPRVSIAFNFGL